MVDPLLWLAEKMGLVPHGQRNALQDRRLDELETMDADHERRILAVEMLLRSRAEKSHRRPYVNMQKGDG